MEVRRLVLTASSVQLSDSPKHLHYPLPALNPTQPISLSSTSKAIMSFSIMRFDTPPTEAVVQPISPPTIQQGPHKRRREASTESNDEPPVKRTRTGHRNPWPRHWYNAQGKMLCQARGCDKVFDDDRKGDQRRNSHVSGTGSAEHQILLRMERQIGCAYCNYRVIHRERRQLFKHEEMAHGTCRMSTLRGFIKLARRGRIVGDLGVQAAPPIFDRLVKNLYIQFPSAPRLLYYRVHHQETDRVDVDDLIRILAPDWTGPEDGTLPGTTLVHPDDFLRHLEPDWLTFTWEERWWSRVWKLLRKMYRKGVI